MNDHPRNTGVSLSPTKIILLYEKQNRKCPYCGGGLHKLAVADGNTIAIDHIVPLSKGGESTFSNYAISCAWCNRRKRTKSAEDFMEEMRPYRELESEGGGK